GAQVVGVEVVGVEVGQGGDVGGRGVGGDLGGDLGGGGGQHADSTAAGAGAVPSRATRSSSTRRVSRSAYMPVVASHARQWSAVRAAGPASSVEVTSQAQRGGAAGTSPGATVVSGTQPVPVRASTVAAATGPGWAVTVTRSVRPVSSCAAWKVAPYSWAV